MKLAIVGSRTFLDYTWMEQCLLRSFRLADIEAVISGGARGADAMAVRFAASHGLPLVVVQADWESHGKKAGPLRNTEIVQQADAVAAFWDGRSAGTRDTIAKARASGKRLVIYPCERPADMSQGRAAYGRSPVVRPLLFSDILFPDEAIEAAAPDVSERTDS